MPLFFSLIEKGIDILYFLIHGRYMWHGALHSFSTAASHLELQKMFPIDVETTNFPTILNIFNTFINQTSNGFMKWKIDSRNLQSIISSPPNQLSRSVAGGRCPNDIKTMRMKWMLRIILTRGIMFDVIDIIDIIDIIDMIANIGRLLAGFWTSGASGSWLPTWSTLCPASCRLCRFFAGKSLNYFTETLENRMSTENAHQCFTQ